MAMISVNGAEFYYELQGIGRPIVLIAGYTCDHTYWQPIVEALSRQFQVLLFDNRGIGQTKDNGEPLSAELMAEDVIQLCEKLNLQKPHIVGQSMGGCIAQTIAARYPEKIGKLVIITTSAKWRAVTYFAFNNMLAMRKENVNFELIMDAVVPWLFGQEFLLDSKKIDAFKQGIRDNPYPPSIKDQERQLLMLKQFDGREQLKRIKASTLIVSAVQDLLSMHADSAWLASEISKTKSIELNCAHGMVSEVPDQLTKTLVEFLAG